MSSVAHAIEMDNTVDNSGSGKFDKLLSAVDALTNQANSIKSELREIKIEKGVTNIIIEVNICGGIVLAITKIIVTIVLNVAHQVICHVGKTKNEMRILVLGAQWSIA